MINNIVGPTVRVVACAMERNLPKILTVASAGASVAACVTTGTSTWRTKDIMEEYDRESTMMKDLIANSDNELEIEEYKSKLKTLRILTIGEVACEYAVPTILLGGSVAASVCSAQIFAKRIGVMAASYAALSSSYSAYRERVAAAVGEEKEDELYKGISEKTITYIDENGNEVTKTVKSYDDVPIGEFCVFWICGSNPYSQDVPELDINFLESIEDCITNQINTEGYAYLDQAYKSVGITPPSVPLGGKAAESIGQIWHHFGKIKSQDRINDYFRYCEENGIEPTDKGIRDANRFSWGISEEQKRAFINGETDGMLLLCPNIDGDIFTGGAFISLRDEDVQLDEKYWGMRPYE